MTQLTKEKSEESPDLKNQPETNLTVKIVSYDIARQLGEAIYGKYKKAFELLKDK